MHLRIWSFEAEMLCELSLVTMQHTKWELSDISKEQRAAKLQRVSELLEELYRYNPDLKYKIKLPAAGSPPSNITSNDVDQSQLQQHIISPALNKQSASFKEHLHKKHRKTVEKIDLTELATLNAEYILKRDYEKYNSEAIRRRQRFEEQKRLEKAIFDSLMEQSRQKVKVKIVPSNQYSALGEEN